MNNGGRFRLKSSWPRVTIVAYPTQKNEKTALAIVLGPSERPHPNDNAHTDAMRDGSSHRRAGRLRLAGRCRAEDSPVWVFELENRTSGTWLFEPLRGLF